jgi:hypothetical protein
MISLQGGEGKGFSKDKIKISANPDPHDLHPPGAKVILHLKNMFSFVPDSVHTFKTSKAAKTPTSM